jgi:hypothetical protein
LIVGIDQYQESRMALGAAVADARAMAEILGSHEDGTANYDCLLWPGQTEREGPVTRAALRKGLQELFADYRGDVLFYFSGHGTISPTGGWLVTSDGSSGDWGIPMEEVLQLALRSDANDILLLLDCCHGGGLADAGLLNTRAGDGRATAALREDMTVIAASMAREVAVEAGGHGLFTAALLSALEGGAADHMGWVTAPSIYAYAERRFGGWPQQPVYKTHATRVSVVRQCAPLVERLKLGRLVEIFPSQDFPFPLDPEFEPEDEEGNVHLPVNPTKVELARLFKEYRDASLLKPSIPGEQLYWTARRSHTVELTPRGREYWRLVRDKKI